MRSLFFKIFLSFWISTALMVSLFILTSERPRMQEAHNAWRSMMGQAVMLNGYGIVRLYDEHGCDPVPGYFAELNRATQVRAFLFDGRGKLLCAPSAPTADQDLALKAIRSGEIELQLENDSHLFAQPGITMSGSRYVMVAEMPHPVPPPRLWNPLRHLVIGIGVSGLVCFLLARYLAAPIARMRTAAQQIAGGNLSARAGEPGSRRRDEVGDLVYDFDSMATQLESLIRAQNQLVSNVSHELRSPLARLSLALGLARQNAGAAVTGPLDRIEREAERLNEMVGRLLTLARLQAPRERAAKTQISLAELIRDAAADADFEAQSRNCQVRFDSSEECTILGHSEALRSAVENVLRNAVRYTNEGSEVQVTLVCDAKSATIKVRDHGPGVPDSELPHLFRPFYRLDQARERETGGVGLGLAIAEQAVKLHRGQIVATNAAGGGLQVEISLPIA